MTVREYIHLVPEDFEIEIRLREYLLGLFPQLETNNSIKKAIKRELVFIDERLGKSGDWVKAGMKIRFLFPTKNRTDAQISVPIIFEDEHLMVVRKAAGIKSSGVGRSFQVVLEAYDGGQNADGLPYPFLVHRLDRDTEGLMIAAKTITTRRLLGQLMETGGIQKRYLAIVEGHVDLAIKKIDLPIDGKVALTNLFSIYHLDTKDSCSLVKIELGTGRTHQIRKHMLELGYPLVGDKIYNREGLTFKRGLMLCSYHIKFIHPISNKMIEAFDLKSKKFSKYYCYL